MSDSNIDNKIAFDHYLDAKGLNCPLPILKTKVLLNKIPVDEIIFVESTDPHSKIDFEAYCARTGHKIIKFDLTNDVYGFYIKRANAPRKL